MSEGDYLIDGRPLGGYSGVRGIGTYVRQLLQAYVDLGAGPRIQVLGWWRDPPPAEVERLGLRSGPGVPRLKRRIQPVADAFLVSVALRRARPSLYHAVEWAQPLLGAGVPVAVTVHDLIPFVFPTLYRWIRRERLLALRQVRDAQAVITPSHATAADVARLGHVDPARITVVPHGIDPQYRPAPAAAIAAARQHHGIERPYILTAGTLDERKRRNVLARVAADVRRHHDVDVVIAGDQAVYLPLVEAALADNGLGPHAHVTGFVDASELAALYSGAACLVFPSAYEGFGLPVLEAMACGAPVVAFDNSAMAEVAGDAGVLLPDGDAEAMAGAVAALLAETEAARADRVERGRRWAAGFTWERSARAHLDVYERLARR